MPTSLAYVREPYLARVFNVSELSFCGGDCVKDKQCQGFLNPPLHAKLFELVENSKVE